MLTKTTNVNGRTLYQIQALRSFGNIKKGDLGGWVEKEALAEINSVIQERKARSNTMANYFRCSECGRYISYKDYKAVSYTNYGATTDYEPPEPVYICGRCYEKTTPEQLKIIHQSAWIKPHRLFGKEVEHDA